MSAGPLVVAHRGAWGEAPQNSLQALEQAIQTGCEMVELDVRRTRDGCLVAVHDARVRGTSVRAQDREQLQARLAPGQAPLLAEMVAAAAGRIALDVELKAPGYADQTLSALGALDADQYVVTSFSDRALAEVRATAPRTRTGLLLGPGRTPRRLEARVRQTGARFLALHASVARAGLLAWATERAMPSYVWTVNDQRALRQWLADDRVAAVITDRPAAAVALRRELAS
ncbi:MAG: glycerophosphodiester phosphodiesterase [Actinomycetota bacterium]|nr:glycerophosphodiester phosphodiesterase [Actinomycetota bacterium]